MSSLLPAARLTAIISFRKERGVTGRGGTVCCCLFSSLLAMIASILRRSEAEHLDWEMVTRSDGCGMTNRSALTSWYWEHARWNEDTAMQDKCFGWAFILARNVSMLETAVWKTSEGRSYQTFRHLRT